MDEVVVDAGFKGELYFFQILELFPQVFLRLLIFFVLVQQPFDNIFF